MLTHRQAQLLDFIRDYSNQHGAAPTYDEMKDALGLKSKSGIHRLVTELEERGFLHRLPHRGRAIEVKRAQVPREDRLYITRVLMDAETALFALSPKCQALAHVRDALQRYGLVEMEIKT